MTYESGPARRREIVFAIADLTRELHRPPTYRELAARMTLPKSTVGCHLTVLRRHGILADGTHNSRCLVLTDGADFWVTQRSAGHVGPVATGDGI